ncbi:MAG TPA: tRNA uracil 4-sulfurtransferase ThiI [Nitrospiria bacterium]|nr:tRNA uracil 4-sulfurtransferase ThiI [Nitrospiria bacterium]
MSARSVVVHYHELALKGRNRPRFLARLTTNLRRSTRGLGVAAVRALPGRVVLDLGEGADVEAVCRRVSAVFGVANYSPAERTERDIDALSAAVSALVGARTFDSFRISARRGDKTYPMTSMELNTMLGRLVQSLRPVRVDLNEPQLTIHVEVLEREALVYTDKRPGPGGLPVGVSGRVVTLLSGGIDSPVAAFRMMRRGCRVSFVHFHSHPFVSRASQEKAVELAQQLARFQAGSRLYFVPFGELQRQVVLGAPAPLRVVLYRRLMMRIAAELAGRERAGALVTGESLGQVASQTLENLRVVDEASPLLVLRPLIGMDKQEIIDQAKEIGTYEISILPDQDCCQLFMPKHPATKTTLEQIRRAERALPVETMVKEAASAATPQRVEAG